MFLYGPFCHGAHKLDLSTLFKTFFLWISLPFILQLNGHFSLVHCQHRWHEWWNGTKTRLAIWGDFVSKKVLEGSLFVLIFTVNRYSLRFSITVVKHANQRCIWHIPDQSNELLACQWIRFWKKNIKTNIVRLIVPVLYLKGSS